MASKYHEVSALGLKLVIGKLGHNNYSKEEILNMELEILQALEFKLKSDYLFSEVHIYFQRKQVELKERLWNNDIEFMKKELRYDLLESMKNINYIFQDKKALGTKLVDDLLPFYDF